MTIKEWIIKELICLYDGIPLLGGLGMATFLGYVIVVDTPELFFMKWVGLFVMLIAGCSLTLFLRFERRMDELIKSNKENFALLDKVSQGLQRRKKA